MTEASVKKIVLDIDGKEIKLTVEQAKELKLILSDMFGGDKFTYIPYYVERSRRPWGFYEWQQPLTIYDSSTTGSLKSDGTVHLSTTAGGAE